MLAMRNLAPAFFALVTLLVGGCSQLPASGPNANVIDPRADSSGAPTEAVAAYSAEEIATGSIGPIFGYELVDLDSRSAPILMKAPGPSFVGSFSSRLPPPRQQVGVGDVLSLTVFEAAPGGLFSPPATAIVSGSRFAVIPNQTVDRDGTVEVPYAGRIQAAGRTPAQIARSAEEQLKDRALEPKVIVTLVKNSASQAAVLGEVSAAARVDLSIRGDRLLSVIAAAGGSKAPEHETLVRLQRQNRTETVPLRTILARPAENIYVQPDDTIFLMRAPSTFTVLGAATRQGQFPLDTVDMSVADGLGKAAGLLDSRADAGGIFLIRYENTAFAKRLLGRSPKVILAKRGVPMVYRIRLKDPRSFHWLSSIALRDRDIVYVSNSPSVEFEKVIGILRDAVSGASVPLSLARGINGLGQ